MDFLSPKFIFTDSRGVKMIGPDPARLDPRDVEIPTLWVLARIAPEMVPSIEEDKTSSDESHGKAQRRKDGKHLWETFAPLRLCVSYASERV